jgi:hypothetical protein
MTWQTLVENLFLGTTRYASARTAIALESGTTGMNSNFVARIRRTEVATKPLIDSELAANLAEIRNVGYQISECPYFRRPGLPEVRRDAILSARARFKNGVIVSFARDFAGGEISINHAWSHALDEDSNRGFTVNAFSATGFGSTTRSVQVPEDPTTCGFTTTAKPTMT